MIWKIDTYSTYAFFDILGNGKLMAAMQNKST